MISTEVKIAQIPEIYLRFASIVGEKYWERRVKLLNSEIKSNRFLSEYYRYENSIAFQLDEYRKLNIKFGGIPLQEIHVGLYPAAGFASQVLAILDASPKGFSELFKRRIKGALNKPDDLRALQLELSVATHFTRRGLKISWPEITGIGTFDFFIEELGSNGLEIECKSISSDKGRKVLRKDALDFYGLLWSQLDIIKKGLSTGLSVVLTLPGRLPTDYQSRLLLAKQIGEQIILGQSVILSDGSSLSISEFEVTPENLNQNSSIRTTLDTITNTRNREAILIETKLGGIFAFAIQSTQNDILIKNIFVMLKDSAKNQFSLTRGGMFLVELNGIDNKSLLSLVSQVEAPIFKPNVLDLKCSEFFSSHNRDHVVGVGFLSNSNIFHSHENYIDSGGSSYFIPNRKSNFWSEDFSGLFS